MEMGNPPLYAALNKVSRTMDEDLLLALGPMARALGKILINAEHYRKENDQIEPGFKDGGCDENLAGTFITFRGAQLKQQWVDGWNKFNK